MHVILVISLALTMISATDYNKHNSYQQYVPSSSATMDYFMSTFRRLYAIISNATFQARFLLVPQLAQQTQPADDRSMMDKSLPWDPNCNHDKPHVRNWPRPKTRPRPTPKIRAADKQRAQFTPDQETDEDGSNSLEEFRKSLGPNAAFIYDSSGQVIGIESLNPSNNQMSRGQNVANEDNNYRNGVQHDQDVCCATRETYFHNATLSDVYQQRHIISQWRHVGSHQFIRHGLCGGRGRCNGRCVQTFVTMSLSVYPPDRGQTNTFKFFSIPGYCSCKRFG